MVLCGIYGWVITSLPYIMISSLIHALFTMPIKLISLNTLRPGQDGRHFADGIFTSIFINENCCILIKFSLKYVRKDPMDNNPALVQIMAWRRSGDKPLSEPMMVNSSTHICVTRPQWVNGPLFVAKLPPHLNLSDHQTDPKNYNSESIFLVYQISQTISSWKILR